MRYKLHKRVFYLQVLFLLCNKNNPHLFKLKSISLVKKMYKLIEKQLKKILVIFDIWL